MIRTVHMDSRLREQHLLARKALRSQAAPPLSLKAPQNGWTSADPGGNVLVQIEHDNVKNVHAGNDLLVVPKSGPLYNMEWTGISPGRNYLFITLAPSGSHCRYAHHNGKDGRSTTVFWQGPTQDRGAVQRDPFSCGHTRMPRRAQCRGVYLQDQVCRDPLWTYPPSLRPEEDGCSFYAETEMGCHIPVIGWLINWLGYALRLAIRKQRSMGSPQYRGNRLYRGLSACHLRQPATVCVIAIVA